MHVLRTRNVNTALHMGAHLLRHDHVRVDTRNGPAMVYPSPVTTHYTHPMERVLFNTTRDANPFFHLVEAMWMLWGARDTSILRYLVPRMEAYCESNMQMHGAYGVRWLDHFYNDNGIIDQIVMAENMLRKNPRDRRVMIQMWDAEHDLGADKKDIPCNTIIKLMGDHREPTRLNMVVFCRSNDIIWGAYGANAVHMSILQEVIASRAGMTVGYYEQVSCDYHAYVDVFAKYAPSDFDPTPGIMNDIRTTPIVTDTDNARAVFFRELNIFMRAAHYNLTRPTPHFPLSRENVDAFHNTIFPRVLHPMLTAYRMYRDGNLPDAVQHLDDAVTHHGRLDWLVASRDWMARRLLQRTLTSTAEGQE